MGLDKLKALHMTVRPDQERRLKMLSASEGLATAFLIRRAIDKFLDAPKETVREDQPVMVITTTKGFEGLIAFGVPAKTVDMNLTKVESPPKEHSEIDEHPRKKRQPWKKTSGERFPGYIITKLGKRPISEHSITGIIYNKYGEWLKTNPALTRTELTSMLEKKSKDWFGKSRTWSASSPLTIMFKRGELIGSMPESTEESK